MLVRNGEVQPASNSVLGDQLTSEQQHGLQGLLEKIADVMQNQPGHTDAAEHTIDTGTARLVKLSPYGLPHVHKETVQREIDEMVENGITEPSRSEWSAPIVLIKKKDCTLCLCVDYCRLNSVSKSDALRLKLMIRSISWVKRVTSPLMISPGNTGRSPWQQMSAFVTPFGLYQFSYAVWVARGSCNIPAFDGLSVMWGWRLCGSIS